MIRFHSHMNCCDKPQPQAYTMNFLFEQPFHSYVGESNIQWAQNVSIKGLK